MIHCESPERRCNSSGGINKHYSKAASALSTNVNVTRGRESPSESPISWVPNLPPLCQIRGPSDEREDKWLPRCNGTQIICCESTVVMVSGVCVGVWAHGVCKLARVRKCKNARLYPEAPRLCVGKENMRVFTAPWFFVYFAAESGSKSIARPSAPLIPSRAFRHRFVL